MRYIGKKWEINICAKCFINICSMRNRIYKYHFCFFSTIQISHNWLRESIDDNYDIMFVSTGYWLFFGIGFMLGRKFIKNE
jgi:hypothetical protein